MRIFKMIVAALILWGLVVPFFKTFCVTVSPMIQLGAYILMLFMIWFDDLPTEKQEKN